MDKKINEKDLSTKNINFNYKSKDINDLSRELILTSIYNKNLKNNSINKINSSSSYKDLNKTIKQQIENDSELSSENNKRDIKKIIKQKDVNSNKKELDKIIVDNIDNIYQNLLKLPNKLLKQKIFLLIIAFYIGSIHWIFLFLTKRKMERDYCYTKLNQFETCIPEQYCSVNAISQINIHLYNDTFIVYNNSLNSHQAFLEEMNAINEYYKEFYANYKYLVSKNKIIKVKDMSSTNIDILNFVIILSKKEKWNIFLKYFSYCDKDMYYYYISGLIMIGGCIGSFLFGLLSDIYGRKKMITVTLFIVTLSLIIITIICFSLDKKHNDFMNEFRKNYISSKNDKNYDILLKIFTQKKVNIAFRTYILFLLFSIFLLNMALRPLSKISLSLLLENSSSDLIVLENLRRVNFISSALPSFIIAHILIILNDFKYLILIFSISFFVLFIFSFFILHESIRHLYEYCEWEELTNEITLLFEVDKSVSINLKIRMNLKCFN